MLSPWEKASQYITTEKDNASGEESVSEYTYEQGRLKTLTENGITESYSYFIAIICRAGKRVLTGRTR